jgi:4-amino-4-deoxy-L-arabinose transferase-like glycosyltransferase
MASIQDLIHRFEERGGTGLRLVFVVLLTLALLVCYNWRGYRNFGTQEAMDAAQVARNLAQGHGFTTQFIRPFSMHLLTKHNVDRMVPTDEVPRPDLAQIREAHPDLANAPLYPLALAAAMKVLPFDFEVNTSDPFWSVPNPRLRGLSEEDLKKVPPRLFTRYQPDFLISLGNQLLLIVVALQAFFLARRLFDQSVAWMTYALVIGSEFLWRFSTTGLSTMLLLVIFLALIWCLVGMENEERDPVWSHRAQTWLALAIGVLLGLGTLTRYSFGWLLIPVLVYLVLVCALRRWRIFTLVLVMFALVMTPWIWRNFTVSGTPFGTAGYALVETTLSLPEYRLQRALEPDFRGVNLTTLRYKFVGNLADIFQNELPRLGGSWVTALFAVGLLLSFRSVALRRLRYFLLGALGVLILVQALGRTQLSVDAPTFNSENLLVLLVPLFFIYGAGLFFQLLDQMNLKVRELRYVVVTAFGLVACLPMLFVFITPKANPVNYPPYYPLTINKLNAYMRPAELTMSDIPWAVAWYADRQCLWITANADSQFFAVHDYLKPIRALYLTPQTTDSRFLSQWIRPGERTWPTFVLEFIVRGRAPDRFPLTFAHRDFFPEQLLLCDWERWKDDEVPFAPPPRDEEPEAKPAPAAAP